MCGIAGIIQSNPNTYSTEHLRRMTDALQHRGPDGEGIWQNERKHVLLGSRRLAIIDLTDAGQQPIHYLGRYTIIHNGEIYNYIEIREELKKHGFVFRSGTDTEVITAAYAHWGTDCLQHFDGMFAFAIWDEEQQELFAARDRFGEKPFFYAFDVAQKLFYFASEMKALWASVLKRNPNRKMLFNFLTIGYTDNPEDPEETFDSEIKKLPPAHYLKVAINKEEWLIITKYWQLDPSFQNKKITDDEAIGQFTQLFNTAVKRRLRSDVTIGTSLSGGIDSSSIVASLVDAKVLQYSPKAFTGIFPGFEKDEAAYSREVAEKFQLAQHCVHVSASDMLKDWDKLCYYQEEPFGSSSIYVQFKVYELAKDHGIKVLLDGQGADETLAGYHKYYKWYWQELFRRNQLKKSGEIKAARELGVTEIFDYKNKIAAWFPSFASIVMERRYLLKAIRHEDLEKEFVQIHSNEAYYTPPDIFNLNGVLFFNSFTHGLEELLRYADRNSMAHSREVRLPFLSHELVSFLFSLPPSFKIRKGWTKWLLRESMKDKLPASIAWRKDKTGFEPPQKKWMEDKLVQEAIREAKKQLVDQKILKPGVLERPVMPQSAHDADNYDWRYFSAAYLFS